MPNIFGLKLLAVLGASVAFYFVGFLVYGLIFAEAWMAAESVAADQSAGGVWMLGGFLITILQVIGIGKVLQWRGVSGVGPAVATAALLWFFFALPFVNYDFLYLPSHNMTVLAIDLFHLLVGWTVSAAVLTLLK